MKQHIMTGCCHCQHGSRLALVRAAVLRKCPPVLRVTRVVPSTTSGVNEPLPCPVLCIHILHTKNPSLRAAPPSRVDRLYTLSRTLEVVLISTTS